MQKFLSILLLLALAAMSACTQQSKNTTSNQPDPKDVKVADGCEGCHAIYESPLPFDQLKDMCWLPDWNEKGQKIAINGVVYNADGSPAPGVIIYIYHTDQTGRYTANKDESGWGKRHGSVRGWMKTNEKGEYKFFTLRPVAYPGASIPAHIHATVKEPGKTEYWIEDFVFDDDPLLTAPERSKMENRGGDGILVFDESQKGMDIKKSSRDIYLGKKVPGYPK